MSLRLALALLPFLAPPLVAQSACPDAFEPNDDCATAAVIATPTLSTQVFLSPAGPDFDPDHFRFTVGPSETLEASCQGVLAPAPEMRLQVYSSDCATLLAEDDGTTFWSNASAQPVDVVLRLENRLPAFFVCELCQLDVQIASDPCIVLQPDPYEPNDVLAAAAALPIGSTWRLSLPRGDIDFFRLPVPRGSIVRVDVRSQDGLGSPPGVIAELFALQGGLLPPPDATGSGAVVNLSDDDEVVLRCRTLECAFYSVHVTVTDGPCTGLLPDVFEDNDDVASAAHLPRGAWLGLNLHLLDPDFYSLPLLPGEAALVEARWDPARFAGVRLIANDPTGRVVAIDQGQDGNSIVAMRNDTAGLAEYVVRALVPNGVTSPMALCVEYDLVARYRMSSLGSVVCDGTATSGDPATELLLLGSADALDQRLVAWTERASASGAHLTPTLLAGSAFDMRVVQGVTLCVGGAGYRVIPSPLFGSSPAVAVDLLGPQAAPFLGALSGTTWVFQFVRSRFGGGLDWSSDARSLTFD